MARGVWTFVALVFGGAVTLQYGCAGPVPDECARHAQGPGIVWIQYKPNCHKYVMCEPVGWGKYRKHVMPCGDLFWDQNAKTCTRTKTGNCVVGSPVGYTGPPPVQGPCPYVRDAHTPQYFFSRADSSQVQHCAIGLEFSEEVCTCLPVSQVEPPCSDDLLLHFDFENGFNDVTCRHAAADQYGDGAVQIVSDPHRGGNVALFNGHGYLEVAFMTSWFADKHVTAFTVSLFFKPANVDSYSVLVNNGNSHEYPSFGLASIDEITQAALITADENRSFYGTVVISPGWHHIAMVYDGHRATLYVDYNVIKTAAVSGDISNRDNPMYIGYFNGMFFEGRMDDIRLYTRALTAAELAAL